MMRFGISELMRFRCDLGFDLVLQWDETFRDLEWNERILHLGGT